MGISFISFTVIRKEKKRQKKRKPLTVGEPGDEAAVRLVHSREKTKKMRKRKPNSRGSGIVSNAKLAQQDADYARVAHGAELPNSDTGGSEGSEYDPTSK